MALRYSQKVNSWKAHHRQNKGTTIFPVCGFFVHNSQIGVKAMKMWKLCETLEFLKWSSSFVNQSLATNAEKLFMKTILENKSNGASEFWSLKIAAMQHITLMAFLIEMIDFPVEFGK